MVNWYKCTSDEAKQSAVQCLRISTISAQRYGRTGEESNKQRIMIDETMENPISLHDLTQVQLT